jgi:hypothetical protein
MSKSYKKVAGWTDSRVNNFYKKYFNKVVRKEGIVPNFSGYKKIKSCNSYSICDYKFLYFSENEIKRSIERPSLYHKKEYKYRMK